MDVELYIDVLCKRENVVNFCLAKYEFSAICSVF